jgi:peptide-methionine (R)-S-oxide reductase
MCNHGRLFTAISACSLVFGMAASEAMAQDPLENAPLAPESMPRAKAIENDGTGSTNKTDAKSKANAKPEFIVKSPAEWRRILTRSQFAVAREKMTEQPFTGKYASGHFKGTFVCVCCDAAHVQSELFSAQTKFDSGTGWPSFYQAFSNRALQTALDYSEGEPRVEVMCRRCGAHLGHVFDDGPPPTGLRFCINSAAIKLANADGEGASKSTAGKTASKVKSKAKSKAAATTGVSSAAKDAPPGESTDSTDSNTPPAAIKSGSDSPPPNSGH